MLHISFFLESPYSTEDIPTKSTKLVSVFGATSLIREEIREENCPEVRTAFISDTELSLQLQEMYTRENIGKNHTFTCQLCFKTFKTLFNIKRHMTTVHSDDTGAQCPDCGKCFKRNDHLKQHRYKCKARM